MYAKTNGQSEGCHRGDNPVCVYGKLCWLVWQVMLACMASYVGLYGKLCWLVWQVMLTCMASYVGLLKLIDSIFKIILESTCMQGSRIDILGNMQAIKLIINYV